jgi:hypothetical protein
MSLTVARITVVGWTGHFLYKSANLTFNLLVWLEFS